MGNSSGGRPCCQHAHCMLLLKRVCDIMFDKNAHLRVAVNCDWPKVHLCGNHFV